MKLQVVLPDEFASMEPSRLTEIAVAAEKLGYETAWLPDHLLPPGEFGETFGGVYEPLIALSYVAARTSRIRLGTSVLVLPMRDPFLLAKQVATLDRFSGERVTLGVGVGWQQTEFEFVGADFRTRGARTDEGLRLIQTLFRGEREFSGKFHTFDGGYFEPLPRGEVPIMVGGLSDAAFRRAMTYGNAWQSVSQDPAEFAGQVARLRTFGTREIRVGTRTSWTGEDKTLGEAVELAHGFAEAGADELAVWFGRDQGFESRMEAFIGAY